MRQHLNEALLWGVLGLAMVSIAFMAAMSIGYWVPWNDANSAPAQGVTIAPAPAPSSAPAAAPAKKLSRTDIAKQKKAAAIAAKGKAHADALDRKADSDALGGLFGTLAILMVPVFLWGIFRVKVERRKYWARVRGEGWEEGRIRAQQRARGV